VQAQIRNVIWQGMQSLEHAKRSLSNKPMQFACRLHALTPPPNAADLCSDWEDKKRMQQLRDEVEERKQEVRNGLSPAQYEDTVKCSEALRNLSAFDHYILLSKASAEYERVREQLARELEEIKNEQVGVPVNPFKAGSRKASKEIRERIQKKEAEIAAHRAAGRLASVSSGERSLGRIAREAVDEIGRPVASPENLKLMEAIDREQEGKEPQAWASSLLTRAGVGQRGLEQPPASAGVDVPAYDLVTLACAYRGELLATVMRCYCLQSLHEAEELVAGTSQDQTNPTGRDTTPPQAGAGTVQESGRPPVVPTSPGPLPIQSAEEAAQRQASLEKEAKGRRIAAIACAVLLLILFASSAVVRYLKAVGAVETTQERTEHIRPSAIFSVLSLATALWIVWLVRRSRHIHTSASRSTSLKKVVDGRKATRGEEFLAY
jgi:hypothetical protein